MHHHSGKLMMVNPLNISTHPWRMMHCSANNATFSSCAGTNAERGGSRMWGTRNRHALQKDPKNLEKFARCCHCLRLPRYSLRCSGTHSEISPPTVCLRATPCMHAISLASWLAKIGRSKKTQMCCVIVCKHALTCSLHLSATHSCVLQ